LREFHLGPGLLAKAVLGKQFSLVPLGATQVGMDLQPLLVLLGYLDGPVHGWTRKWPRTILVATLVLARWSSS